MIPSISQNKTLQSLIDILETYINFLHTFKSLLNTHNVQFLVDNHWANETYLNKDLRADLDKFIQHEQSLKPNLIRECYLTQENTHLQTLASLIASLKSLDSVWQTQVITAPEKIFQNEFRPELSDFERRFEAKFKVLEKQNRFMNKKKSYEVDIMSKFVGKLCKMLDLKTV